MTRGETRHGSGRETSIGRRLRVGAMGSVAIGGAIFMGGAATLVTAFANTGGVAASQNCTTWRASARLDDNVAKRLVTVTSTIPGVPGFSGIVTTDGSDGMPKGPKTLVDQSGAAPQSGSITEIIYLNSTNATPEHTYTATLLAPSNCTSAISTTPSVGGVVGTAIHDSARVTGSTGSPAGTVVFALFPPSNSNCSSTGTAPALSPAVALTSTTPGVSTASSPSFTTSKVGIYHWVVSYSGSSIYKSAKSNCEEEAATISQGGPTITTLAGSGGTVPVDVTDTATLSGGVNPTGTVTFTLYPSVADCNAGTNAVGSPSIANLAAGKATSAPVHVTTAGTYQWLAKYSGDANNAAVSSTCGSEPVTTTSGGGGVQGITTPSTGDSSSLTGVTVGGFLLLGGLGAALAGSILPRRRRSAR